MPDDTFIWLHELGHKLGELYQTDSPANKLSQHVSSNPIIQVLARSLLESFGLGGLNYNSFGQAARNVQHREPLNQPVSIVDLAPWLPRSESERFTEATNTAMPWYTLRRFPGIGDEGGYGINPGDQPWGGPGEAYAEVLAAAGGDISHIPPALRQFYPGVGGTPTWNSREFRPYPSFSGPFLSQPEWTYGYWR